jgi:hypothetical protein
MLPKSNSVPNFLFEIPQPKTKQYNLKLYNFPKIISYSEFLKSTPKATKTERREAIRSFYNTLLHK